MSSTGDFYLPPPRIVISLNDMNGKLARRFPHLLTITALLPNPLHY